MSDFKPPLENFLAREWRRRGPVAWALTPFACIFGAIAATRRAFYGLGWMKRVEVGAPVVVVGNVTVGGTGKTPTVIALVEALRAAGFQPGVISRGYGAKIAKPTSVTASSAAEQVGDEPLLIARRTHAPVFVCPDPAGPLREPMSRRRDATLINSPYERTLPPWPNTFALELESGDAWLLDDPHQRRPLNQFAGEKVVAAAGIGSPERFFATLRAAGIAPATRAFPDHYAYRENPFAGVDADAILITEKGAVKLGAWRDARIWVVPVQAVLRPRLIALVVEKLRGRSLA